MVQCNSFCCSWLDVVVMHPIMYSIFEFQLGFEVGSIQVVVLCLETIWCHILPFQ